MTKRWRQRAGADASPGAGLRAAGVIGFIAFFAILLTKRFPRGLFDFTVGIHRWNYRVSVYTSLGRDEYPPFSLR